MKLPAQLSLVGIIAAFCLTACTKVSDTKSLFNGKDLAGWEGLPAFWSVKDGAITGQTTAENVLKSNTFLVWKGGEPANFELRLSFKLTPNNDRNQANSGVQFRSKVLDPATFAVGGYQADIDSTGRYAGMLYEEKGRGILMAPGEKIRVTGSTKDEKGKQRPAVEKSVATPAPDVLAAYKLGDWNQLTIIAKGNHVQQFLNGKLSADVTDDDAANAPKSGVIALQLHVGPPMTVQFKDIQLKTLP
jgi:hypothetical protein